MSSASHVLVPEEHRLALCSIVGVAIGVFLHHGLLIHGEWHVHSPQILTTHLGVFGLLKGLTYFAKNTLLEVLNAGLIIFWTYLVGLAISITIYRVFFHRLSRADIPGPWYLRPSKIGHLWLARASKNHLALDRLHKKYGDVVRTGPAEVTVFTPDFFLKADGPRAQCIKSEFYDLLGGIGSRSLVTTRDNATHNMRRKEWRSGFTTESMKAYRVKILPHVNRLLEMIGEDIQGGKTSSVRDYMYWFSFDAMGEFVFSKSFGMLQDREESVIIKRLQNALSLLGPLAPTPWLLQIGLTLVPHVGVIKDWFDTLDFCRSSMASRLAASQVLKSQQSKSKEPGLSSLSPVSQDLAHHLMEREHLRQGSSVNNVGTRQSWNMSWLTGDSLLAIVAGSDPTTGTLIGLFAELAKQPQYAEALYEESAEKDVEDFTELANLPLLNAVIKETMRLYPSILSGGSRKTMDQPVEIGGKIIPPHITIVAPRYTINRRADCFVRPEEFIPERWTTKPEMILNREGYTPFGTGSRACLGRYLADDLMRVLVARIIKSYRFKLAPGKQGTG